MNLDDLQRRLFSAARACAPRAEVPFGFEQRVMAHLRGLSAHDPWATWAAALWRAAAPCVAVMLILGALFLFSPAAHFQSGDFSQDFETTVLAAAGVDQPAADAAR